MYIHIYVYFKKCYLILSHYYLNEKKISKKYKKIYKMCLESSSAGFNQQFPGATLQVCID